MAEAASVVEKPILKTFRKGATAMQVLEGLDLKGKHCLVTGGNSGIGYEAARALALHNAHVVLACRNTAAANEAKEKIVQEKSDAQVSILQLDCNDLSSVEFCANKYLQSGWPLHILILNAGVYGPPHRITDAGFEATFQINHLAQFYLTQLLQPRLMQSAPARVVVVSSDAHKTIRWGPGDITWEKLSPTHKHKLNSVYNAYGISKLCNALYALELNTRLSPQGVTAYSLHPGVVQTNITRNSGGLSFFFKVAKPFVITPEKGAATTVYCAAMPDLEASGHAGAYFSFTRPRGATAAAKNAESAAKLWDLSQEMIQHYQTSVTKQQDTEVKTTSHTE